MGIGFGVKEMSNNRIKVGFDCPSCGTITGGPKCIIRHTNAWRRTVPASNIYKKRSKCMVCDSNLRHYFLVELT